MRYEVVQLLQFMFSLSLVLIAFMVGLFVGWRRWGRDGSHPVDHSDDPVGVTGAWAETGPGDARNTPTPRRDLFAPELDLDLEAELVDAEVDLRVGPAVEPLGLPSGPLAEMDDAGSGSHEAYG